MSGLGFHPLPPGLVDERWRPLDAAVARWVLAHEGDEVLARCAAEASLADGQGDSLWPVPAADAGALALSPLVEVIAPNQPTITSRPFVLEGDAFYLRRNHRHEVAAAARLCSLLSAASGLPAIDQACIDLLFDGDVRNEVQPQREAVRRAPSQRLFVLTGGPGTGKTRTVLRMLLAHARMFELLHGALPRIALAAPTGKAAARLGEALRDADHAGLPDDWHPVVGHVRSAEPQTLHRLLGAVPGRGYRHHQENPLPLDLMVVDEASMVDLAQLRAVLDGLPAAAQLWLVGDSEQLDAVSTGAALQQLVARLEGGPALVRLQHSFRAQAALQALNAAVSTGDVEGWNDVVAGAGDAIRQVTVHGQAEFDQAIERWCDRLAVAFDAAGRDTDAALASLSSMQLMCALREGPRGVEGIARRIDDILAARAGLAAGDWYPGKRVLITRNDPAAGLFNGDIGLCVFDAGGDPWIAFLPLAQSTGEPRLFAPAQLPPHESAAAITVHKSQGSEYAHVGIVLPADARHPILSRQWLYTAVSRARRSLEIWGSDAAIAQAIARRVERASGLAARIG